MINSSRQGLPSEHTRRLRISKLLNPEPLEKIFTMPKNGETIVSQQGSYQLGNVLGIGHFGTTFECFDQWGNHLVAKVLHPLNRSYEEVRDEWLKEFAKLMQLRHAHITLIHDAFEYKDTFYLIIERCLTTLETVIEEIGHRSDVANLILPYVARDVLQAVAFIHRNGYVHKDIHPGNVFVSEVQRPSVYNQLQLSFVVGDLGISNLEKDINIFNTVLADWMLPPESINPKYGSIGKSVDIYHTGLLLLSVLRGEVQQFTKDEVLNGEPRRVAESLSSPYGSVIGEMLRRHVKWRANNIGEIWNKIRSIRM